MTFEQQIEKFVTENDLKLFLDHISLAKAARMAREQGVPGSLKVIAAALKPARIDMCLFWGKRLKPTNKDKVMPSEYWEKLRAAVLRYEHVLVDLYPKHAEMVLRISVGTNISLMRGLAKRFHVWKG